MEAFETIDVSRGNFFALMFFVVACGNFVAYAIAGWLSNVIAQVRPVALIPDHLLTLPTTAHHEVLQKRDIQQYSPPGHGIL